MMLLSRLAGLLLVMIALSACSNIRTYSNSLDKNLTVMTRTDSGSIFSSVKASLDIYRLNDKCEGDYAGTVSLGKDKRRVGLPTDQVTYLVFRFNSSGFLSNTSSAISHETLLKPRKGYFYVADVRYSDDIYNVEIIEKRSAKAKGREVVQKSIDECHHL